MAEGDFTTELGGSIRRLFGRGHKERKEEMDSGQALANFIDRLTKSPNITAKRLGGTLEVVFSRVAEDFVKQKAKEPELTLEEYMGLTQGDEVPPYLIPGPGWEDKKFVIGNKPKGIRPDVLFTILGEQGMSLEERFQALGKSKQNNSLEVVDANPFFTVWDPEKKSFETGKTKFRGLFAFLRGERERASGVKLWIRQEENNEKGSYLVGKGMIQGLALTVPVKTAAKYVGRLVAQTEKAQ